MALKRTGAAALINSRRAPNSSSRGGRFRPGMKRLKAHILRAANRPAKTHIANARLELRYTARLIRLKGTITNRFARATKRTASYQILRRANVIAVIARMISYKANAEKLNWSRESSAPTSRESVVTELTP